MKFFNRFRKTYKFNAKEKKIDVVCTKYVVRSEFNITANTLEEKPNKRTTTIKKTTSLYEIKTELEEKFNKPQPSSRKLEETSSPEPLYTQVFNKSKSEENISSTSLQNHESDYDSQEESRRSSAKVVAEVEIHNASSNPVPELRKTVSDVELRKKDLKETLTVTSDNATPKNALEENSSNVEEHSSSGEQHNKLSSPRLIKRPAHLALNDYAKAFKEMSSKNNLEEHSSNFETTPIPPYSTKTRPSSMLIVEYARSLVDNSEEELEEILSEPIITSPRNTFDIQQQSSIARPTSLPFKLIDYSAEPEELVSPYDDLEEITSAPIITSPTNPYDPIFNERSTSFTLEEISSQLAKTPVEENNTFVAENTLDDNGASIFDSAEKYTWLVGTKLEEDSSKTIETNEDLGNHENIHELSPGYEQEEDALLEEIKVEETKIEENKVEEIKVEENGNNVDENGVDKNIDMLDISAANGKEEDKNVEEHLEEKHIVTVIKPEESKEDLFSTETTFYIPAEKLEESITFFNNNVLTKVKDNQEDYSFIETQYYSPELEENTLTFNNNVEETLEDYEVHVVKHDNNAYDSEDSQSEEDYINFGVVEVEETKLKNQKKVVHFNEQVKDIDGKIDNGDLILNGNALEENKSLAEKREMMDLEESNVLNGHGSPYTEAATDIFFDAE